MISTFVKWKEKSTLEPPMQYKMCFVHVTQVQYTWYLYYECKIKQRYGLGGIYTHFCHYFMLVYLATTTSPSILYYQFWHLTMEIPVNTCATFTEIVQLVQAQRIYISVF